MYIHTYIHYFFNTTNNSRHYLQVFLVMKKWWIGASIFIRAWLPPHKCLASQSYLLWLFITTINIAWPYLSCGMRQQFLDTDASYKYRKSYGYLTQGSCPVLGLGGVSKNPYCKELICYKILYTTFNFSGLLWTKKWNLRFQKNERIRPTISPPT